MPAACETMPHPPITAESSARIHALDNLRAFAMLLGIFLHAAIPFIKHPGAELWPIVNSDRSWAFDLPVGVIHSFRMQLFFLMAGFFSALLVERRGWGYFGRNRALRIGVPFLLGMVTVVPLTHYLWGHRLQGLSPVHLWFLEYLLIFYVSAGCTVGVGRLFPGKLRALVCRAWHRTLASPWKPLLLAVPTALLNWPSPVWDEEQNARGISLIPNVPALLHYGLFFWCGWAMHRHRELLNHWKRHTTIYFALGFIAFCASVLMLLGEQYFGIPLMGWSRAAVFLVGSAVPWLFSFAFLALFLTRASDPHPVASYLSEASYWMYLAHLPLVIFLQLLIVPLPWPSLGKFLLINALTFFLLLVSYDFAIRSTFLGQLLNGRRTAGFLSSK